MIQGGGRVGLKLLGEIAGDYQKVSHAVIRAYQERGRKERPATVEGDI